MAKKIIAKQKGKENLSKVVKRVNNRQINATTTLTNNRIREGSGAANNKIINLANTLNVAGTKNIVFTKKSKANLGMVSTLQNGKYLITTYADPKTGKVKSYGFKAKGQKGIEANLGIQHQVGFAVTNHKRVTNTSQSGGNSALYDYGMGVHNTGMVDNPLGLKANGQKYMGEVIITGDTVKRVKGQGIATAAGTTNSKSVNRMKEDSWQAMSKFDKFRTLALMSGPDFKVNSNATATAKQKAQQAKTITKGIQTAGSVVGGVGKGLKGFSKGFKMR